MGQLDTVLFGSKTMADLVEEIYTNQNTKKTQIRDLILQLKPLVKDIGDATLLVPLIKEYLDIGVKNDDQLIKLGNLAQKILQSDEGDDDFGLTEYEKEELNELSQGVVEKL